MCEVGDRKHFNLYINQSQLVFDTCNKIEGVIAEVTLMATTQLFTVLFRSPAKQQNIYFLDTFKLIQTTTLLRGWTGVSGTAQWK